MKALRFAIASVFFVTFAQCRTVNVQTSRSLRVGEAIRSQKEEPEATDAVKQTNKEVDKAEGLLAGGEDEVEGHKHEEGGEEGEGHEHGEEAEEGPESGIGHVVTMGMMGTIVLLALLFALTNTSNAAARVYTWQTLDNVICIFLAVMVFQAVDEMVIDAHLIPHEHQVLGMVIYALVLFALACIISFALKGRPSDLAIFVGSSAHFVSFGFMHAADTAFEHHEGIKKACILLVVIAALIAAIYVGAYQIKKALNVLEDDEMMEKIDDLENDAGAMCVALSFTIVVAYIITSEHQEIEEKEESSAEEKRKMLYYALFATVLSCVLVYFLGGLEDSSSYVVKRCGMFLKSLCGMCCAWGWLLWGKWYFHESLYEYAPMFSRVYFAFWVSIAAMVVILILSKIPAGSAGRRDKALALMVMGLLAGWSWEETFDAGIEILAEEQKHEFTGYKILLAVMMLSVILPVHIIYFKPMVMTLPSVEDEK